MEKEGVQVTLADKWNDLAAQHSDWFDEDVSETLDLKEVSREHVGSRRWEEDYLVTVTDGNEYAQYVWSVGATEYQDNPNLGEQRTQAYVVVPQEVTVVKYVKP